MSVSNIQTVSGIFEIFHAMRYKHSNKDLKVRHRRRIKAKSPARKAEKSAIRAGHSLSSVYLPKTTTAVPFYFFGANKNAKRAAMVHLSFNVIGTAVWVTAFCVRPSCCRCRDSLKRLFSDTAFSELSVISAAVRYNNENFSQNLGFYESKYALS